MTKTSVPQEYLKETYKYILDYVRKYHNRYYPSMPDGSIEDVAHDIYLKFVTPYKHRDGQTYSEVDRIDLNKLATGDENWKGGNLTKYLAYLKMYTLHRMIEKEKYAQSHKTQLVAETSSNDDDDKRQGPTLDKLSQQAKQLESAAIDLVSDPDAVLQATRALANNPSRISYIERLIKHYGDRLDPRLVGVLNDMIRKAKKNNALNSTSDLHNIEMTFRKVCDPAKISTQKFRGQSNVPRLEFDDAEEAKDACRGANQVAFTEQLHKAGFTDYVLSRNYIYLLK